jgi:hypothetical protein
VVGPYIKDDVITMLKDALQARQNPRPLSVRVITRSLSDDFLSGASDTAALQHLLAWPDELPGSTVEVRVINNIHAKVWVFDSDLAFVGSGNATFSGMEVNLEYGIAISDPQIIASILQDWQEWWEQAAPLNAEMLDELHRWLDALTNDAEVRVAEKLVQEMRKAAERRIGAVPRIGKRVIVAPRDRRTIQERAQTPYMVPQTQDEVLPAQSEVMRVPAYHLWQALTWTTPLFDEISLSEHTRSGFLKIIGRSIAASQYILQCNWADGRRSSQATMQVSAPKTHESWAVTLDGTAIARLAEFLQQIPDLIHSNYPPSADILLWLQPFPLRLCMTQTHMDSSVPVIIPCSPANVPGSFSVLRPPLSQIVIEQEQLLAGFTTLEQQWQMRASSSSLPETIEMSFGVPGVLSTLQLSIGPIEAPLSVSVPGTDCVLHGPGITLRLDMTSLKHIVSCATHRVQCWQLSVGRDADTVQFEPQFEEEMIWANTLAWRQELRDVTAS